MAILEFMHMKFRRRARPVRHDNVLASSEVRSYPSHIAANIPSYGTHLRSAATTNVVHHIGRGTLLAQNMGAYGPAGFQTTTASTLRAPTGHQGRFTSTRTCWSVPQDADFVVSLERRTLGTFEIGLDELGLALRIVRPPRLVSPVRRHPEPMVVPMA